MRTIRAGEYGASALRPKQARARHAGHWMMQASLSCGGDYGPAQGIGRGGHYRFDGSAGAVASNSELAQ
jgi:hypothetical protein